MMKPVITGKNKFNHLVHDVFHDKVELMRFAVNTKDVVGTLATRIHVS
jgi:hypothetical protein